MDGFSYLYTLNKKCHESHILPPPPLPVLTPTQWIRWRNLVRVWIHQSCSNNIYC